MEITFNDASELPAIPSGSKKYFLVVMEVDRPCFGAYYLNNYALHYEECPLASKENNWTSCKDCENGNGHIESGWFEEQGFDDESVFKKIDDEFSHVIAWALPPIFKGYS